jgi:hypothetical protein
MTDWLTKLVLGEGNVIRERSLTNWNTFDASKVVEEKEREREREKASSAAASGGTSAESSEDRNTERE